MKPAGNTAHSVRQRLLNFAQARNENFDLVMVRYANERLLHRLSRSEYSGRFVLKGATLFLVWSNHAPHRSTRDLDLLATRRETADDLINVFRTLCTMEAADGLILKPESVAVTTIREDQRYGGHRVTLMGGLQGARIPVQIDVGSGDAITPKAEWVEVPSILDGQPRFRIKAYPVYTVMAEKFEAVVQLGTANSRMKDFYDLDFLLRKFPVDEAVLAQALKRTFERRGTPWPPLRVEAFTPAFHQQKEPQWRQFLIRSKLGESADLDFRRLLLRLRKRLMPMLRAAATATE